MLLQTPSFISHLSIVWGSEYIMTLIQCSHGMYLSSIESASLRICSTLVMPLYNGFMSPKIGDLEEIILVAIHKSISVEVLTGGLKQGQPPHTPVKDLGLGLRSKKNHCATDIIHQSWIFHRQGHHQLSRAISH